MAFEARAFKSARVDVGSTGPAEYYLRATRRTRDELRIQYRFLSPPAHETTSQESCANLACPAVLKDQFEEPKAKKADPSYVDSHCKNQACHRQNVMKERSWVDREKCAKGVYENSCHEFRSFLGPGHQPKKSHRNFDVGPSMQRGDFKNC